MSDSAAVMELCLEMAYSIQYESGPVSAMDLIRKHSAYLEETEIENHRLGYVVRSILDAMCSAGMVRQLDQTRANRERYGRLYVWIDNEGKSDVSANSRSV